MNPNNSNPYQQPQSTSPQPEGQPQQPQVVIGGGAQPIAPVQSQQPYPPQQPISQSSGTNGSRNKLLFASKIMSVVILVMAGLIILVAHLLSHKIANTPVTSYGPSSSSSSAGSSSSSSASTTSKSACDLFGLSDAQAVLGSTTHLISPTAPKTQGNLTTSICIYVADGDSITVTVIAATNSSGIQSSWAKVVSSASSNGATKVANVGDQAYYLASTKYLDVLKGNIILAVIMDSGQPKEVQVANTAISHF